MIDAVIALLALQAAPAAVPPPPAPPHAPGVIGTPAGSGASPAVAEVAASLPDHTLYHPVKSPAVRMPIILWGNGGCRDNGLSASHFLREIASHGYFVVAVGHARSERPVGPPPALVPIPATPVVFNGPGAGDDETWTRQMFEGLDWAIAENKRAGSPWQGKLDPAKVAVMGHSCGGLQAIEASADPRVRTSIIWNSGTYERGNAGTRKGVAVDRSAVTRFHAPIAYIAGGPSDIAWAGATGDFDRIAGVPALFAWKSFGHGGTFGVANGGEYGEIGAAWLDWQLRGDAKAGAMFTGAECGLCTRPDWTVKRKGID